MAVMRRVSSALVIALAVLATPVAAPAQEKIRLGLIPISEALVAVIADKQGFFNMDRPQSGVQGQGAAAAAWHRDQRCRHGPNHGADAEIRFAQGADRHLATCARGSLS